MRVQAIIVLSLLTSLCPAQVVLNADGPGDTYELITSVLAPGEKPIEAPDCNHESFGEHIDELFDDDLNKNVFRFHIHTSPDNDRCINFDRQRNEIKSYDKSPDNLLGIDGETVSYKWKFKLAFGFQSSPNFTHLHQLKSVGGDLESMPMYTLTTRKGNPDQLELRYAETNKQVTLIKTDLEPFIGEWVEVTETIEYGRSGTYEIEIKRVNDDEVLFSYADDRIINWRPGASFVRPKWGIYRSLINSQDLRDEEVLFADFIVEEKGTTSNIESTSRLFEIYPNPVKNTLYVNHLDGEINTVSVYGITGKEFLRKSINSYPSYELDVSSLVNGTYILHLKGESTNQTKLFIVLAK